MEFPQIEEKETSETSSFIVWFSTDENQAFPTYWTAALACGPEEPLASELRAIIARHA